MKKDSLRPKAAAKTKGGKPSYAEVVAKHADKKSKKTTLALQRAQSPAKGPIPEKGKTPEKGTGENRKGQQHWNPACCPMALEKRGRLLPGA